MTGGASRKKDVDALVRSLSPEEAYWARLEAPFGYGRVLRDRFGGIDSIISTRTTIALATLKETKWVLSGPRGAATRLGMNRSTLQFRMKKLGIVRPWACECQL